MSKGGVPWSDFLDPRQIELNSASGVYLRLNTICDSPRYRHVMNSVKNFRLFAAVGLWVAGIQVVIREREDGSKDDRGPFPCL